MESLEDKLFRELDEMLERKTKNEVISVRISELDLDWIKKKGLTYSYVFHIGLGIIKRRDKKTA